MPPMILLTMKYEVIWYFRLFEIVSNLWMDNTAKVTIETSPRVKNLWIRGLQIYIFFFNRRRPFLSFGGPQLYFWSCANHLFLCYECFCILHKAENAHRFESEPNYVYSTLTVQSRLLMRDLLLKSKPSGFLMTFQRTVI